MFYSSLELGVVRFVCETNNGKVKTFTHYENYNSICYLLWDSLQHFNKSSFRGEIII